MATYHCQIKTGNKGKGACASAKADYICREGKYSGKGDIEGEPIHGNMPSFAQANPGEFWQAADLNERANGRVYTEIEIALPREILPADRRKLVEGFIKEQLPNNPYTVAIHCPKAAIEGGEQPHAHIIFSERIMDNIDRPADQFFKRAAAPYRDRVTKEMKEGDPAKGGAKKDLAWHGYGTDKVQQVREAWERHYNKAVHFPEIQVSCKSLREQGINREPERHLGYALSRSAAADHVKDRRHDHQRLEQINIEIARATKAEATRKEKERQEQKPAAQVQPVKPIIVPAQPTAVTAVAPQLRKFEPVKQEPVSPVKPVPVVPEPSPAQREPERPLPPVKETNLPIPQPAVDAKPLAVDSSVELGAGADSSVDVGVPEVAPPTVEDHRRRLTQIETEMNLISRKHQPTPEEREAHKTAYMKPATDRFNTYQRAVVTFNQENKAWREQGETKGWTYAPPLSKDAGFFEKTARATADRFRSEEEKTWQKQGHTLNTRRDGLIEEKQNTERFKLVTTADYMTRGTQELFIATQGKIKADPKHQILQTEKNAINAAIQEIKKKERAIEKTLDKDRGMGRSR